MQSKIQAHPHANKNHVEEIQWSLRKWNKWSDMVFAPLSSQFLARRALNLNQGLAASYIRNDETKSNSKNWIERKYISVLNQFVCYMRAQFSVWSCGINTIFKCIVSFTLYRTQICECSIYIAWTARLHREKYNKHFHLRFDYVCALDDRNCQSCHKKQILVARCAAAVHIV